MKLIFFKCLGLVGLLAFGNAHAVENIKLSYDVKALRAPDTKSLWASDKLIADIGDAIKAQEVQELIQQAVEGCVQFFKQDPLKCRLLDNVISVKGAYHYRIISAEDLSGLCGASGFCAILIFDEAKKRIVYNGDAYGVSASGGKLYATDPDGKGTAIELK
jgi:hypothetical protein